MVQKCALGHNNSFDNIVKSMTSNLAGWFTNQSLRRTGATRLFERDFDEDMVSRQTGHKPSAVRIYKETSSEQQISLSHALYDSKETNIQIKKVEQVIPEIFSDTFNNCIFNVSITKWDEKSRLLTCRHSFTCYLIIIGSEEAFFFIANRDCKDCRDCSRL